TEAVNVAATGNGEKARALLAEVDRLAEGAGLAEMEAHAAMGRGICSLLLGGFERGAVESGRAVALYRDRSGGSGWELGNAQLFALLSRLYLGELARLGREWPEAAREASVRGDLHGAISLRTGHTALVWLALDDPESARRDLDEAAQLGARSR